MSYRCLFTLAGLLGLALVASGCAAAALPAAYYAMAAAGYGISAASVVSTHTHASRQNDIAQQNADTYRAHVEVWQATAGPQCQAPEARTACPLYQHRVGLYRARCADGSGLDVSPGKLLIIPPAVERPRPWDADGCTL